MNKVFTIAMREFKAAVLTKAFIISLAIMPLMMGGSIIIQFLVKDIKSTKEKKFVVIDRTPGSTLFQAIDEAMKVRNEKLIFDSDTGKQKAPKFTVTLLAPSEATPEARLQQRFELAEQVRKQEIFGFVDIGANVLKSPVLDEKYLTAYAATLAASVGELGRERDKVQAAQLPDDLVIRY